MLKSTGYKKIETICEICGCIPCDCHGVEDELWIMGTTGSTKTRKISNLASWKDRLSSFTLVQVESGLIEPKNRILLPRVQGDLPSEEGTDRENNTGRSEGNGD